jgi:hypothetical protein
MKRYPSAKSAAFGILVWGLILILLVSAIIVPPQYRYPTIAGSLVGIGFMLWMWFGAYYEFRETYLLLRMGPFFERIPYIKIFSARKFKGMMSSMALSSDMLELRHGKNYITGTTYISPEDRDAFIAELKLWCPGLNSTTPGH